MNRTRAHTSTHTTSQGNRQKRTLHIAEEESKDTPLQSRVLLSYEHYMYVHLCNEKLHNTKRGYGAHFPTAHRKSHRRTIGITARGVKKINGIALHLPHTLRSYGVSLALGIPSAKRGEFGSEEEEACAPCWSCLTERLSLSPQRIRIFRLSTSPSTHPFL